MRSNNEKPQWNSILKQLDDFDVVTGCYRKTWKSLGILIYWTTVGALCVFVAWLSSHLTSPSPARPHDFFDAQTMDAIRHRAICLNLATHIESVGNGHSVVFHSTVSLCSFITLCFLVELVSVCIFNVQTQWVGYSETRVKGGIVLSFGEMIRCIPL